MRREWEPEDLVTCWTLVDPDCDLGQVNLETLLRQVATLRQVRTVRLPADVLLTPLLWSNIKPSNGEIHLDMTRRLGLIAPPTAGSHV